MNEATTRCIETCLSCYKACVSTAMNHCLEVGGKHVEPALLSPDDGLVGRSVAPRLTSC